MPRIPKALKVSLFALGGLAGVVVVAALAVVAFVDVEDYRPRVETAASGALGMDVTVKGPLRIAFFPRLHVVLGNVSVLNRGTQLAFIESADLAIELLPLLRQELRYSGISLKRARLTIERGRDGRYNYQKPPASAAAFRPLNLERVSFPSLALVYFDKASGTGFEAGNCSGELTDLGHPGGAPFLMRLSLAGQVACDELRSRETTVSDVKFSLVATDGVFDFKPVTMRLAGGQGSGSLRVDRSAAIQVLHLDYSLSSFHVEQYFKELPADRAVKGVMDFSTTLVMRGGSRVELKQSAQGEMSLSGKDLTLTGVDLDQAFTRYAATQNFSLLDLGAFVLAGPLGLVATKGYEFSSLSGKAGGSTRIRNVVSRWKVEKGVAHATDVAMATQENRLALKGGLDFVRDQYSGVVVAVIDSNGCAKVRQRIHGRFSKPVVEKPGVLESLAGPAVNLLGKARDILSGGTKCEPFYQGSVAPPK